jgi:FKBP-type peptidyl-prolyl cis-trans isomerase
MKTLLAALSLLSLLILSSCGSDSVTKPKPPELIVTDLVIGSGAAAAKGDTLEVTFVGRFPDSTVFDSSAYFGRTLTFTLGAGQVIEGWEMGMPGAREGGIRRLVIPPDLAYGARGFPGVIPPNATLVFDVQVLDVRSRAKFRSTRTPSLLGRAMPWFQGD